MLITRNSARSVSSLSNDEGHLESSHDSTISFNDAARLGLTPQMTRSLEIMYSLQTQCEKPSNIDDVLGVWHS